MKRSLFNPLLFLTGLLACLLCAGPSSAQNSKDVLEKAESLKLWQSEKWMALGHYKKTLFGYKSQVDDLRFFISPRGKRDPKAELESTLDAFSRIDASTDADHQPPCLYPARYAWLTEELNWDPPRMQSSCPDLEDWLERLNGQSLSIIFASAYLHSPASMYGHSFLRLDQDEQAGSSMLSYSINFAADTTENNGLLFAVKGLTGFYPGRFSTIPYYIKILRYGNIENRDLWEYQLNFSSAEIHGLLLHLWEVGRAYSDYYFTLENCSYQLLPLLEVARPSLRLSSQFHLSAIPADTIRAVTKASGLAGRRRVRPSALVKMIESRNVLEPQEIKIAENAARFPFRLPAILDPIPEERRGLVMLAAYNLFRYSQGHARFLTPEQEEQERKILLEMSKLEIPDELEVREGTDSQAPDMGHRTRRAGFLGGLREGDPVFEISLRPALHDFMDNEQGYTPFSRLEMFHIKARYNAQDQKAILRQLYLVDILSLSPLDRWARKPSWGVSLGLDSRSDIKNQSWDSTYLHANGKSGASFLTVAGDRKILFYALAQLDGGAGPAFGRRFRTGAGVLPGVIFDVSTKIRVSLEGDYRYYFLGENETRLGWKASSSYSVTRGTQLRFTFEEEDSVREYLLGFFYFL